MIPRYLRPEMARIWSDENKFRIWLQIEIAACEAQAKLGLMPKAALTRIKRRADFDMERILLIEETVKHDVIAFLTDVAAHIGEAARFLHLGMTSSDVLDTALAVQMKQAGKLLLADLDEVLAALKKQALQHKDTPMIGRSHGVHAEPITFGLKLAVWYDEMRRNRRRLEAAIADIAVGKLSGAVGTFANLGPAVEAHVCRKLGLKPAPASTQIVQRDRHAHYLTTLAIIAGSADKFATELRNLQRTEILEVEEFFSKGQKGSSAMPHKRNPITGENISGLARVVRANALVALENQALWHERDISHSSAERIIIPDSTAALHHMLKNLARILSSLLVYPQAMAANLERTRGLIHSQRVLLALVDAGMSREEAYAVVQKHALAAWQRRRDFHKLLEKDRRVAACLTKKQLAGCFDLSRHTRHVETIYKRVGLLT